MCSLKFRNPSNGQSSFGSTWNKIWTVETWKSITQDDIFHHYRHVIARPAQLDSWETFNLNVPLWRGADLWRKRRGKLAYIRSLRMEAETDTPPPPLASPGPPPRLRLGAAPGAASRGLFGSQSRTPSRRQIKRNKRLSESMRPAVRPRLRYVSDTYRIILWPKYYTICKRSPPCIQYFMTRDRSIFFET